MKTVIRILNFVIMALSAVATVFLFVSTPLSFNSKIALDVKAFSQFVPETTYTHDIHIDQLLGTDTIYVSLKFKADAGGMSSIMNGDRNKINEMFITGNVNEIAKTLHEPVDLITDFSIKTVLKSTIQEEVTTQINAARDNYANQAPNPDLVPTTESIMSEVGMDDNYFLYYAITLYDEANKDTASVDSVSEILYQIVDTALAAADESGAVDTSEFGEDMKASIRTSLVQILTELKLVKDDGVHIKKISSISYIYLSDFLVQKLTGKVDAAQLVQGATETAQDYTDRLLNLFVVTQIPDTVYQVIGYVSLGLFIGMFVFAATWLFLFVFTAIKTFSKKPWTFFGPWFWIVGILQLVMGIGITVAGKFILPIYFQTIPGLPISSIILAPRTYALVPSIMFVACFALAIIYIFFKVPAKRQAKAEAMK